MCENCSLEVDWKTVVQVSGENRSYRLHVFYSYVNEVEISLV